MAKLNFKQIVSRHEILALAIGGVLVVVCVVWGLILFLDAASPVDAMQQTKNELEQKRKANPPPPRTSIPMPIIDWPPVTKNDIHLQDKPWFETGAGDSTGRQSPRILGLDVPDGLQIDYLHQVFAGFPYYHWRGEGLQIDYLHHGAHVYALNTAQDKIEAFNAGGNANPVPLYTAIAKRIVVVNMTFSYAEQAELFRKAMHLDKLNELYGRGYAPTIEGLNIERCKPVYKDGKWETGAWEVLYSFDVDGDKLTVAPWLEKFFKTAVIDDSQATVYQHVIHSMSVTPLPKLTDGANYPAVLLPGISDRRKQEPPPKPDKAKKEEPPPQLKGSGDPRPLGHQPSRMPPTPADKAEKYASVEVSTLLDANLKEQIAGKLNWFSPWGSFTEDPAKAVQKDKVDLNPGFKPADEDIKDLFVYNFKSRMYPPTNEKALVRFCDVEVAPGAVYQYKVQLRFANPNYKQPVKYLAHSGLAEQKELLSAWKELPRFQVPSSEADYRLYITHLKSSAKDAVVSKVTSSGAAKPIDIATPRTGPDYVPFQIFKFVDATKGQEVADWVVAERLYAVRGEPIGRECELEVAVWQKQRTTRESAGGPKGLTVDMRSSPSIVLLDFTGGIGQPIKGPISGKSLGTDDSEYQVLMLMPDMTMRLRESRDDYADKSPRVAERLSLFDIWKKRLEEARPKKKDDKGK